MISKCSIVIIDVGQSFHSFTSCGWTSPGYTIDAYSYWISLVNLMMDAYCIHKTSPGFNIRLSVDPCINNDSLLVFIHMLIIFIKMIVLAV